MDVDEDFGKLTPHSEITNFSHAGVIHSELNPPQHITFMTQTERPPSNFLYELD